MRSAGGAADSGKQLPAFRRIQQRQPSNRRLRVRDDGFKQRAEMAEPAPDRRRVENVRVVTANHAQSARARVAIDAEVELERTARVRIEFVRESGETDFTQRRIEIENRRDQRHATGHARHRKILQQPAEGDAPVLERLDHRVLSLCQQARECRRAVGLRAKRQHVHAMPDEMPATRRVVLSGGRDADGEIVLSGQAVKQCLIRGEQHAEKRRAVLRPEACERLQQFRRPDGHLACAAKTPLRRMRAVAGQFERRRHVAEFFEPEIRLGHELRCGVRFRLPFCVVAHLHRPGKRMVAAFAGGRVNFRQFVQEDVARPAVAREMMRVENKRVLRRGEFHQLQREHRAAQKVERAQTFRGAQRGEFFRACFFIERGEIGERDINREGRRDSERFARRIERAAQRVVPDCDFLNRAAQRRDIKFAVEPQRPGFVARGVCGRAALREQENLALRFGELDFFRPGDLRCR